MATAAKRYIPPPTVGPGPALARVATKSKPLPDRIVLYADAKWGKTSFAAQFPRPIFLTTRGEDGLQKLIERGLLGETPHFQDVAHSWGDVELAVHDLIVTDHPYETFVLDTANGAERLAHERVCADEFDNDWSEKGFNGYGRGEKISTNRLWIPFLGLLDHLRERRRMRILLVCHADARTKKNPGGLDYQKTQPALTTTAWKATSKWADMILYGDFETYVKESPNKTATAKATGGDSRILYCNPRAHFDAGNRHGLPDEVECGQGPQEAWANFLAAFKKPNPNPQP